jgi:hypothetical protein
MIHCCNPEWFHNDGRGGRRKCFEIFPERGSATRSGFAKKNALKISETGRSLAVLRLTKPRFALRTRRSLVLPSAAMDEGLEYPVQHADGDEGDNDGN